MIECAEWVIALIDSSKFGKIDLTPFANAHQIHHLYTDNNLSEDWQNKLHQEGIDFTLCA
ncbi:MAG: DeoR family transcriptional regulator, partial [Anaerolineae bacterium]|nr:DeoR family transcriptional regulator [Anaerolineae bacterium]